MVDEKQIKIELLNIKEMNYHSIPWFRIIWILEGEIEIGFIGGKATLEEGSIETLNINEPVSIFGAEENKVLVISFSKELCLKWEPSIENKIINIATTAFFADTALLKKNRNRNVDSFKEKTKKFLKLHIDNSKSNVNDLELQQKGKDIMQFLVENFDDIKENLLAIPGIKQTEVERFLSVDNYMLNNLSNKVTLNDISDLTHMTSTYMSAEITSKFTKSFQSIMTYYRTMHAVSLLLNSDFTNSEIIDKAGFSSEKYYYKAIKEQFDMSPNSFRKENANKRFSYTILDDKNSFIENICLSTGKANITESKISNIHDSKIPKGFSEYSPGVYGTDGVEGKIFYIETNANLMLKRAYGDSIKILKGKEIKILEHEKYDDWIVIENMSDEEDGIVVITQNHINNLEPHS